MKRWFVWSAACVALGFVGSAELRAEEPVIGEVLQIMRERGLIDEAKHAELVSRNAAYEEENTGLLGKIEWSGDLRARLENFWYDEDDLGSERANRTRGRYRLRIAAKAKVNEWTTVRFRLASGLDDIRSTNVSFGNVNDFNNDGIRIDQAFIEFKAPKPWLGENNSLKLLVGKSSNPFRWKNGKDYLIWDSDITPEGASLLFESRPYENTRAYATVGYYISDENSTSQDPHVTAVQGGVDYAPSELVDVGLRGSFYSFASLNPEFLMRSSVAGAVTDDGFRTFEIAGYARYKGIEDWPILLYGHYARNLDAGTAAMSSDEDTGFGVGLEVGDKKKNVKLGFGYYLSEANYFPAQFTDSDLFDGRTNRKGFTVYGSRQVLPNTDLNVTLFKSDELRSGLPTFETSVRNADRIRLQTDIVVKF